MPSVFAPFPLFSPISLSSEQCEFEHSTHSCAQFQVSNLYRFDYESQSVHFLPVNPNMRLNRPDDGNTEKK